MLRYFFYLGINWDFRLAGFVLWHEWLGERKYRIHTTGTYDLNDVPDKAAREHATSYEPINYYTAEWLMNRLEKADRRAAFLDMGCGKGRMLAVAAAYGFKHIIGVDFSPFLCTVANDLKANLVKQFDALAIEVHCANARHYQIPDEVGVIFLFNPFDAILMEAFVQQVQSSLARKKRPLKILYANPQHKQVWLEAGFRELDAFKKLRYMEASLLSLD